MRIVQNIFRWFPIRNWVPNYELQPLEVLISKKWRKCYRIRYSTCVFEYYALHLYRNSFSCRIAYYQPRILKFSKSTNDTFWKLSFSSKHPFLIFLFEICTFLFGIYIRLRRTSRPRLNRRYFIFTVASCRSAPRRSSTSPPFKAQYSNLEIPKRLRVEVLTRPQKRNAPMYILCSLWLFNFLILLETRTSTLFFLISGVPR